MGAEAKLYLQEHSIPQLFEGLMTGLIYNRPPDPLEFLEKAIQKVKGNPDSELSWDMFIEKGISTGERRDIASKRAVRTQNGVTRDSRKLEVERKTKTVKSREVSIEHSSRETTREKSASRVQSRNKTSESVHSTSSMGIQRSPSVIKAAEVAHIPNVPIILFMGGPGGGKTRHAAKVSAALDERGLVHICMPDVIRQALTKYKDKYPEWKEANNNYLRGELIPNHLALALVRAEMGRHKEATAFFLEGFPREARQVEDFERQVKSVNMALIIDYDEKTLRDHMERRGLGMELIDQKIKEFKQKTLPSAKYFDDQKLLHLIPGERDDQTIYERMKTLVERAMDSGVPVYNSNPPSQAEHRPAPVVEPSQETPAPPPPLVTTDPEKEVTDTTTEPEPVIVSKPPTPTKPPSSNKSNGSASSQNRASSSKRESIASKSVRREGSSKSRATTQESKRQSITSANEEILPSTAGSASGKVRATPETEPQPAVIAEEESIPKTTDSAPSSANKAAENPVENELTDSQAAESAPTVVVAPPSAKPPSGESRTDTSASFPRGLPNNAPVVLIVGAPGAQKLEIAKRAVQKYDGFILLSMGDLLRKKVAEEKEDELWQRVGRKMDLGEPVPMKLCRELLYTEMHRIGQSSWGYVIEGYPRSQTQVTDMEDTIERIDLVILIDCTEQYCEDVVAKRHKEGGTRADDSPEVFKARLTAFKQNTLPMLKYLDDKGKLRVVDGDADPDTAFKEVAQAIDTALFIEEDDGSGHSLDESKKGSLNG